MISGLYLILSPLSQRSGDIAGGGRGGSLHGRQHKGLDAAGRAVSGDGADAQGIDRPLHHQPSAVEHRLLDGGDAAVGEDLPDLRVVNFKVRQPDS